MKLHETLLFLFFSAVILSCNNEKPKVAVVKIEEGIKISHGVKIIPITHGTLILETDTEVIYIDPTGGKEIFEGQKDPTLILITDIHGDHLSTSTLEVLAQPLLFYFFVPKDYSTMYLACSVRLQAPL